MTLFIKESIQLAGYYRLQVMRDGVVRQDTGWFKNLITDQGLNWIGCLTNIAPAIGNTLNTHVGVGTGTATPAFTDTRLASPLAMFPTVGSSVIPFILSYVAGVTPYWSAIWAYQFALGAVVGNISEVGVGNTRSTDTDPLLFSRCLILDSFGNPTVISVTALDVLVVTYELRYYIATGDNTYSIVIGGTFGPITYTGTYRRMAIGTVPRIYFPILEQISGVVVEGATSYVYEGFALGPITGNPIYTHFTLILSAAHTCIPYVNGNYYAEITSHFPLSGGNFATGITGFSVVSNHGSYQFSISPAIPKTSSYILDLTWQVHWSRYP